MSPEETRDELPCLFFVLVIKSTYLLNKAQIPVAHAARALQVSGL
jgi:hypothetical protein